MCILYDNSRSNLNIIAPNHNAFRFVSETEMYYFFTWDLATLAFCTIKSRRTNTDVVSINNNTLAVIMAGGAATWCHCVKYIRKRFKDIEGLIKSLKL